MAGERHVHRQPGRRLREEAHIFTNWISPQKKLEHFEGTIKPMVAAPGVLAPITHIGGGELRVDRAADSGTAVWSDEDLNGSLSFGYHALTVTTSFQKTLVVRNYRATSRTYSVTPTFRYADDAASGAVSFNVR